MDSIITEAGQMQTHLDNNDLRSAISSAEKLQSIIDHKEKLLEGLVPHEDLHDLSIQISDASLSILINDLDDCKKALKLMKENAEHLIKHESFLFGNIF